MIGNVSDWLSYAGGALIKVADSAGSTVFINRVMFASYMTRTCIGEHVDLVVEHQILNSEVFGHSVQVLEQRKQHINVPKYRVNTWEAVGLLAHD